jgi:phage terminase large subunit
MELEIKTTGVFTKNYDALLDNKIRFVINMGGTRSSKTISICQLIIVYCLKNPNKLVSITRKSFPSLRATVMRDMIELLTDYKLYNERQHNKTDNIFQFQNGSKIEFFSLDDSQKIRGRKRDLLFMNEANELSFEEFNQLNFRTNDKIIADFNPSTDDHFIYDLMEKEDAVKIHSTFRDNPFLDKRIVKEIEALKDTDFDLYQVYNLGLPSKSTATIFNHQKPFIEDLIRYDETILGLDFGFQHPTALIRCDFKEDMAFVRELIFESYLTGDELVDKMNNIFTNEGLSKSTLIVADYARPELIETLRRNGFNVLNADKSVKAGIDAVKSTKLFYHNDSNNLKKEFRNYKWKMVGDRIIDEPVKLHDDGMDAMRYAILYHKKSRVDTGGFDFISF